VPEENQRLRLYKKIAGATSEAAVAEVRAEMEDRYGAPPDATVYLLEASMVRLECERIGIAQVDRKRTEVHIRFMEKAAIEPQQLMRLVARNAKRGAQFTPQGLLSFRLPRPERRSSTGDSRIDCRPFACAGERITQSTESCTRVSKLSSATRS